MCKSDDSEFLSVTRVVGTEGLNSGKLVLYTVPPWHYYVTGLSPVMFNLLCKLGSRR